MIFTCYFWVVFSAICQNGFAQEMTTDQPNANNSREAKAFSIFNIVRFRNGVCSTTSGKNGTCYTTDECSQRNGNPVGTCASGYGVCCLFSFKCGETFAERCSYMAKSSTSTIPKICSYTICRCNSNICRIRLDFINFNIAGPQSNLIVPRRGTVDTARALDTAIGDCVQETFTITSPGQVSPPVICGFNSGQHMFLDASDDCQSVTFNTAPPSMSTWDIKVTQYDCGSDAGGSPGCLQYFTGTSGTVASFNYPTNDPTVPISATHLSNQCYTMCFRQEPGHCAICYVPAILGDNSGLGSFGLSNPTKMFGRAVAGVQCLSDFIRIPIGQAKGGVRNIRFAIGDLGPAVGSKYCGRYLGQDETMDGTLICSQMRPFRLDFKTNADEQVALGTSQDASNSELVGSSAGTIGFNLDWALIPC